MPFWPAHNPFTSIPLRRVDESEHVVEDIVALTLTKKLESLRVAHGLLLLIDQQTTGDHDHDAALRVRRLSIEGRDLVLHLLEGKRRQLLNNAADALNRGCFEGKHRVVTVETGQRLTVGVEGLVVELHELLSNILEVGHFDEYTLLQSGRKQRGE